VQDLRDAEGLTRPLLRRAALRLALSPRAPVRRLGSAYLRLDPPEPSELPKKADVIETTGSSSSPRALPPAPPGAAGLTSNGDRPHVEEKPPPV